MRQKSKPMQYPRTIVVNSYSEISRGEYYIYEAFQLHVPPVNLQGNKVTDSTTTCSRMQSVAWVQQSITLKVGVSRTQLYIVNTRKHGLKSSYSSKR